MIKDEETAHLIKSITSLMQSLCYKDLKSSEVVEALAQLKKSSGFKKVIGELSSVHVLNIGTAEAHGGAQRFRKKDALSTDISFGNLVLQVYINGEWIDADSDDLPY